MACGEEAGTRTRQDSSIQVAVGQPALSHIGPEPAASPSFEPSDPAFTLEPEFLQMGLVDQGTVARGQLLFKNHSEQGLRVVKIEASCGCVRFEYERGEVPPGGERPVTVLLQPRSNSARSVRVTFQANDPGFTRRTATVEYFMRPVLKFVPERVDFGRCQVGSRTERRLSLRYETLESEGTFLPNGQLQEPVPVEAELGEPIIRKSGDVLSVEIPVLVRLDTQEEAKSFRTLFRFAGPEHVTADLPIAGQVYSEWYLETDRVHLGMFPAGKRKKRVVRLHYVREPPEIVELISSSGSVSASYEIQPEARLLNLKILAKSEDPGEIDARLEIVIRGKDEPAVIQVRGLVRGE